MKVQSKKTEAKRMVYTEQQIKWKMAGFLANYNRRINRCQNTEERDTLIANRAAFMEACRKRIMHENRKAIQSRAGRLAWETRRSNKANSPVKRTDTSNGKASSRRGVVRKAEKYSNVIRSRVQSRKR